MLRTSILLEGYLLYQSGLCWKRVGQRLGIDADRLRSAIYYATNHSKR